MLDPIEEDAPSEQPPSPSSESVPSPEAEPSPQGRAGDSFSIISIVLAVVFLLGVGWFVLDQTNVWPPTPSPTPNVTAEQGPGGSDTADAQQTDRLSGVNANTQDDQDTAAQDTTAQDTTAQTTGGWSIVVASRAYRAAAEEMADEYKRRFDSVEVVSGTVDDKTWYRVAVGRYDSEAAAERAIDENASALPSGAWSHRLR
jgi:cytoskeletal protein RodZ